MGTDIYDAQPYMTRVLTAQKKPSYLDNVGLSNHQIYLYQSCLLALMMRKHSLTHTVIDTM